MRRAHIGANAAVLIVSLGLLAGCDGSGPHPERSGAPGGPQRSGALVKDAWSGVGAEHSRLEMKQVERFADRSVLRFYVTNLGRESAKIQFPASLTSQNIDFRLVDPVGGKAYTPLFDASDEQVGSEPPFSDPGVRYEAVLDFPPVPRGVDRVTVLTPSTAGEFTGVPVVAGSGPMTPVAPTSTDDGTPAPGATLAWPMRDVDGAVKGSVQDLYGITEDAATSTATSSEQESVSLRTDVLFAFDSARLSPAAGALLDRVAGEVRRKADPARSPITIEGHTDGRGTHDYNIRLSQQRADAVLKELRARLGGGYRYRTAAKGETEPVAEEGGAGDDKARARNRRVEIAYRLKPQGAATTGTPGPGRPGATWPPAPSHPSDGGTVASRTADFSSYDRTRRRIDVKPFYRDGAYLVAVFEITNLGPGELKAIDDYSGLTGSHFGTFGVIDPASKAVYRGVRIGPENDAQGTLNRNYVDPDWVVWNTAVNTANRGFFYVPAPPSEVRSVTFDAGAFGQIPDVPVR